ncbi:MAG: aminoacyl-tRNA hydrolase [Clostridiales bacterium]|nr:aminoacyl-tRNA hydrolase [Clostridiales bacterium]
MYIIVGLGNPGRKYIGTRHNIGFDAITRLSDDFNISLNINKHKAICGAGYIAGQKVLLAQPQTYMNLSGESVRALADFYKVAPENIIVIYDDINLEEGQLRIRKSGSAGGHNGIKNIIQHLGTKDFPRIRIGVGQKPEEWDLVDYVLSKFSDEENKIMRIALKNASDATKVLIEEGITAAMNLYNRRVDLG